MVKEPNMKRTILIAAAFLLFATGAVSLHAQSQNLPISDFVAVQPAGAYTSWLDPISGNWLYFDAFGRRAEYFGLNLGTTISGTVMVNDLGDGTERVTIVQHTRNAVCWGSVWNGSANVLGFGRTPAMIFNGANASLGNGMMRLQFTKPVGSQLPRYGWLGNPYFPAYVLEFMSATIMCQNGELRAASGYPDGTPGFAQTIQTGLYNTGAPTGCPNEGDADCFPAEKVQFKPAGN